MLENLGHLHYSCIYEQQEEGVKVCLEPPKHWVALPLAIYACLGSSQIAEAAPLLQYGDGGKAVAKLQDQLKQAGCFPKTMGSTGYYGTITRTAVEMLQRQNGLVEDGIAGEQTFAALVENQTCEASNAEAVLKPKDRNREVKLLQIQLKNWGFPLDGSNLQPTGEFDASTQKALKEFEGYFGLEQDGVFDSLDSEILWTNRGETLANLLAENDSYKLKQALAAMGPDAFSYLPLLLQTSKYENSADILRAMKPEDAVAGLNRLLGSEDEEDWAAAGYLIYTLASKREPNKPLSPDLTGIVPTLISLLNSQIQGARFVAASALGDIGHDVGKNAKNAENAVQRLRNILISRKEADDLAATADALGGIGPTAKAAVPELIRLLTDDRQSNFSTEDDDARLVNNASVSYLAASALEKIGPDAKAAIPALVDQLQHEGDKVAKITDEKAIKKIRKAAYALAKIAPSQSLLSQAPTSDGKKLRRGIAFAIGARPTFEAEPNEDPIARGKLQEIVSNPNENLELRKTAAISLTLLTKDGKWLSNFPSLAKVWNSCPRLKSEASGIEEKKFYFDPATRKCRPQDSGVGNGIKSWRDWFAGKIGSKRWGRKT